MKISTFPCSITCRPVLGDEMPIIALHGVECMKDDPTAVDVLFAKVSLTDSTDRYWNIRS